MIKLLILLALLIACGGTWVVQDGIASVLHYLKDEDENWHFNQALRILRIIWGLVLIASGVLIILTLLGGISVIKFTGG